MLFVLTAAMLSCNDNNDVKPERKEAAIVAPPPRTFPVNAKLSNCLATQTADVYIRINSGSWIYVNSVTSTTCDQIGSFSANNGDVVEVKVLELTNGWEAEFRAKTALSCPTTSWPAYCGATPFTLTASDPALSITITVDSGACGGLWIC